MRSSRSLPSMPMGVRVLCVSPMRVSSAQRSTCSAAHVWYEHDSLLLREALASAYVDNTPSLLRVSSHVTQIGLHACGNLTNAIIRLFRESALYASFLAMCVVM